MTRDEETIRHAIPEGRGLHEALRKMAELATCSGMSVTADWCGMVLVMDPNATANETMCELLTMALERMKEARQ